MARVEERFGSVAEGSPQVIKYKLSGEGESTIYPGGFSGRRQPLRLTGRAAWQHQRDLL
jgi:hypothetical protein